MMYKIFVRLFKSGRKKKSDNGFSLLEVLIAVLLFSVFYLVYSTSERMNLMTSTQWQKEMVLLELCDRIMSETINKPPPFNDSLTLIPETKNFEESELQDYQYTITWKRFELPANFVDLLFAAGGDTGSDNEGEGGGAPTGNAQNSAMLKQVFTQVQKNLKNLIWQIQVTVEDKASKEKFLLSTWIRNPEAKVEIAGAGAGAGAGQTPPATQQGDGAEQ